MRSVHRCHPVDRIPTGRCGASWTGMARRHPPFRGARLSSLARRTLDSWPARRPPGMVVGGSRHLVFLSRTRLSLSRSLCTAGGAQSAAARCRTTGNPLLVLLRIGTSLLPLCGKLSRHLAESPRNTAGCPSTINSSCQRRLKIGCGNYADVSAELHLYGVFSCMNDTPPWIECLPVFQPCKYPPSPWPASYSSA